MATFVLVHGGWGGGWEWRFVDERLTAAGHAVHRPTLTGLGDRRHLGRPETDLDTHIADVIGLLETEELDDVVLVGHSYGGAVVTGVTDRLPRRIGRLVYIDAFVPRDGESVNDLSGARFAERLRALAERDGGGWQVPVPFAPEEVVEDIPRARQGWYLEHIGPHPLRVVRAAAAPDRRRRPRAAVVHLVPAASGGVVGVRAVRGAGTGRGLGRPLAARRPRRPGHRPRRAGGDPRRHRGRRSGSGAVPVATPVESAT